MKENLTRRHFLNLVGAAGGSTAIYQTSLAMGLMQDTGARARIELAQANRKSKKVAILGAGIAGLTVAYELQKAGYDCTIIEASHFINNFFSCSPTKFFRIINSHNQRISKIIFNTY